MDSSEGQDLPWLPCCTWRGMAGDVCCKNILYGVDMACRQSRLVLPALSVASGRHGPSPS